MSTKKTLDSDDSIDTFCHMFKEEIIPILNKLKKQRWREHLPPPFYEANQTNLIRKGIQTNNPMVVDVKILNKMLANQI